MIIDLRTPGEHRAEAFAACEAAQAGKEAP